MKHGVAFRKLSRTSSHRMLMLRNLVTALFEHQQIKTTLPKAKEAARLAEKIITIGKNGGQVAQERANAFLLKPTAVTNLFDIFSKRYADRPGGYTRIHKFGNRFGDNAPNAILELVDNPRDLRWMMTSRAIGRELLQRLVRKGGDFSSVLSSGIGDVGSVLEKEKSLPVDAKGVLRPITRSNLQKLLKGGDSNAIERLSKMATEHADQLMADPLTQSALFDIARVNNPSAFPPRRRAGQQFVIEKRPALSIAKAGLDPSRPHLPSKKAFSFENALTRALRPSTEPNRPR